MRTTPALRAALLAAALLAPLARARDAAAQAPAAAAPAVAVASVDMDRAVRENARGRQAAAELRQMFDARQAALNREQATLHAERAHLEATQSGVVDRARWEAQREALARRIADLQQRFTAYQAEINQREQALVATLLQRLEGVVRECARQRRIGYVVRRDGIIVTGAPARRMPDITEDVIREFDRRFPLAAQPAGAADAGPPARR